MVKAGNITAPFVPCYQIIYPGLLLLGIRFRRGCLGVQFKQVGYDFFFVAIEIDAVSLFDCRIKRFVSSKQIGWHFVWAIEVCKGFTWVSFAHIQNSLRALFYLRTHLLRHGLFNGDIEVAYCARPDEVVIYDGIGIVVITF